MGAGELIAQNTTHADRVSRLIEQWSGKPDLASILRSYLAQAQDIEDALFEIISERCLDVAVGVQLDTLGRLVKQPRTTASDDRFRTAIRARIAINKSNGTAEDLIRVASLLLTEFGEAFELRDEPPAQVRVTVIDALQSGDPDLLAALLNEARLGGVRLLFQHNDEATALERLSWGGEPIYAKAPAAAPVLDRSGNGNDGATVSVVDGDITSDTPGGVSAFSMSFSTLGYVDFGNVAAFDPEAATDPFSFGIWIKTTAAAGFSFIASKSSGLNGWTFYASAGQLYVRIGNGLGLPNYAEVRTTVTIHDGAWHWVAFAHSPGLDVSTIAIFVDDTEPALTTVQNGLGAATTKSTAPFQIGARNNASPIIASQLDEPVAFASAIDLARSVEIFEAGPPPTAADMLGHWGLGEDDGSPPAAGGVLGSVPIYAKQTASQDCPDVMGSGDDLTPTNMADGDFVDSTFGGVSAFSAVFAGGTSNDHLAGGNIPDVDLLTTEAFTLTYRFKTTSTATGYTVTNQLSAVRGWYVYMDTSGRTSWNLRSDSPTRMEVRSDATGLNDGAEHCVVIRKSAGVDASTVTIDIDGATVASTIIADNVATNTVHPSAVFNVAARDGGVTEFDGEIVEVAIWKERLDDDGAAEIWNKGEPPELDKLPGVSAPVRYWKIGELSASAPVTNPGALSSVTD